MDMHTKKIESAVCNLRMINYLMVSITITYQIPYTSICVNNLLEKQCMFCIKPRKKDVRTVITNNEGH